MLSDLGAIGGTAMWAWQVLKQAKAHWSEQFPGTPMPVDVENQLLNYFYVMLPEYRDESGASFLIHNFGSDRITFHCTLEPEELVQTYEDATAHAFALIEEGILELKELMPSCDRVDILIGGGSAKAPMWIKRMIKLREKHGMDVPTYLSEFDGQYQ